MYFGKHFNASGDFVEVIGSNEVKEADGRVGFDDFGVEFASIFFFLLECFSDEAVHWDFGEEDAVVVVDSCDNCGGDVLDSG